MTLRVAPIAESNDPMLIPPILAATVPPRAVFIVAAILASAAGKRTGLLSFPANAADILSVVYKKNIHEFY